MLAITSLLLPVLQAPAPPATPLPPLVEAKTLPGVPGPMVPHYPDPSRGLGPRDLDWVIRNRARHGVNIPAVAVPEGSCRIADQISDLAGWKAYRIEVPGHGGFKVRLRGTHEAWFLVKVLNRWGRMEQGMLQNRIPTGNPEASYQNPDGKPKTVYIVVDTSETHMQGEGFTLTILRN